ncbi:PRC-barrel domain containing protein [Paracoccus aurantiacus]|uniref:PRC-barrel domain containing protein n=2 Tax=Paracoccus aurantiacus TaxID=2599412 RepID=A0A5C6S5T5_9RHOB|nr:PRC-barrel domain containing protein [Paracoccus aurantiacus]
MDAPAADAAAPAAATDAPAADAAATDPGEAMKTGLLRASALDGVDIYTVDATGATTWDDNTEYTAIDTNWEKIGEVEDLVLDAKGDVVGAIAEVGGFLGLGEKEVVLQPDEVAIVMTEDKIAVVSALSKEALEQREQVAEDIRGDD